MDETKLAADLPNVRMEIVHRAAPDGNGEMITLNLHATPDFRAALPLLSQAAQPLLGAGFASPLALWTQATQALWAPWLALAKANPFLAPSLDEKEGRTKK